MASINTPEEVMAAEQEPGAVFLDVRGEDEVKAESLQSRPYKQAKCSLDDCSELMSKAETLMSDKNGEVRCTQFFCREMRTLLTQINSFLFLSVLCQNYNSTSYHILSLWTPSRQGERGIRAKGL